METCLKNIAKSIFDIEKFLSDIDLAIISDKNYIKCETENTHDNRLVALKSTPNNKTAGNDGLYKEFYETLWDYIKYISINSSKLAKVGGSLGILPRKAVIKLLEKNDSDKKFPKIGGLFLYSMLMQKQQLKALLQDVNLFDPLLSLQINHVCGKKMHE